MTEDYRVSLDAFEGPLDLLLFLIRKNEVDVHDIPIATITDQYLAMVAQMRLTNQAMLDIDAAGEFLVMAATLTEIKSRMLMPKATLQSDGTMSEAPAPDPRAELVRQLLEYKQYRDAADTLERRAELWRGRFPSGRAMIDESALDAVADQELELEDLNLLDLVEAFRRIQETVNFDRLGDHQITYDDTPIELHAQDILARLHEAKTATNGSTNIELRELFTGRTRSEMVGLFLALLELVRNRKVRVRQERTQEGLGDGPILLSARDDEPAHTDTHHDEHTTETHTVA